MARSLSNWLDAYCEWAEDGFTPPHFNRWVGLSVLAGALERKVWLPMGGTFSYKPNIYVMLINRPGTGKSRAGNKGIDLLTEVAQRGSVVFLPDQVTESAFFNIMGSRTTYEYKNRTFHQTAAFYYAREASSSLKDIWGGFLTLLTDLYDCPDLKENETVSKGRRKIHNACINILACSTHDYLKKLLSDDTIGNGFASRVIYVTARDHVAERRYEIGKNNEDADEAYMSMRRRLISDLSEINKMTGPFSADASYEEAWHEWIVDFSKRMASINSEAVQDTIVRSEPNIYKVSMLLSAAESDDRIMTGKHFKAAAELVEASNSAVPKMLVDTRAAGQNQRGLAMSIMKCALERPTRKALKAHLITQGFGSRQIQETLDAMFEHGILGHGSSDSVEVLSNPENYL